MGAFYRSSSGATMNTMQKVSTFIDEQGDISLTVEDDDAWERAETVVVNARSKDKPGELSAIDNVLDQIRLAQAAGPSTKWQEALKVIATHGIAIGVIATPADYG